MPDGRLPVARLHVLGGVRLTAADGADATPRSVKARAMLAYLALAPGGGCERGKLAGLLWSESAEAKTSLRQAVRELRQTLAAAGLDTLLESDPSRVALDLRCLWVDALEVQRLARSPQPDAIDALAALYLGDLLEGVDPRDPEFEGWLLVERARLRAQVGRALETALEPGPDDPDPERLERIAKALLAVEPAHEAAHRALMRCHARSGDVAAAIRQYQTCKELLARELGLGPSAETEALLRELRTTAPRQGFARLPPPSRAPPGPAPVLSEPAMRATIAVEEQAPLGGDPTDAAVVAALAASLREALARKRWLSVLASAPARLIGLGEAARPETEPSYRVGLALLRLGDRLRLIGELRQATTGRILWAEHYDRTLAGDVLGAVDELAGTLARRLDREVELAEVLRASRRPLEAMSAYDHVLRAIPLIFRLTPEAFAEADRQLRAAEAADPHEPMVYAWRAFWYFLHIGQGWAADPKTAREELAAIVRRAIELDPANALALAVAGHIASFVDHDYERGLGLLEQSLSLDPNSAYAWDLSAVTLCYTGEAKEALRRIEMSRDLWQRHPNPYYFQTTACIALMLAGEHERAIELSRRTVRENPSFHAPYRPLIASLGHTGRIEEARRYLAELRRVEPDFSIGWFRTKYPPLGRDYGELYIAGLRKAGVPEE